MADCFKILRAISRGSFCNFIVYMYVCRLLDIMRYDFWLPHFDMQNDTITIVIVILQ